MRRYVSHTCGVEYIAIEKSACTSIKAALLLSDGIQPPAILSDVHHHPHWHEPSPIDWVFSFVRHPLIRPVSLWWDMVRTGRSHEFMADLSPQISFAQFIRWIATAAPNRHYSPQAMVLDTSKNGHAIDFVGHVESIGSDWRVVQEHAPGMPQLLHRNASGRPKDWRSLYDAETVEIATRIYAADFWRWPQYATDPHLGGA